MSRGSVNRRLAAMLVAAGIAAGAEAADLLPAATAAAFSHYVALTEGRIDGELQSDDRFLWIDTLPAARRHEASRRMRRGEAVIEHLETLDGGRPISIPAGLVNHWLGIVFIPGVSVQQTLATLQDYERYPRMFAPVLHARIVDRQGDDFTVHTRTAVEKHLASWVMDMETEIHYSWLDAAHVSCRGSATRIVDIKDHDTPQERQRRSALLWRLSHYARFAERDGGTYLQFEVISLSRDIPRAFIWLLPVLRPLVKAEFAKALEATRSEVIRQHSEWRQPPR